MQPHRNREFIRSCKNIPGHKKQMTQATGTDERLVYKRLLTQVHFTDKKDPSAHENTVHAPFFTQGGVCWGSPVIYFNHIYS